MPRPKRFVGDGNSNRGGLLDYANEALCDGCYLHNKRIEGGSKYRLTCDSDGEFKFTELKV